MEKGKLHQVIEAEAKICCLARPRGRDRRGRGPPGPAPTHMPAQGAGAAAPLGSAPRCQAGETLARYSPRAKGKKGSRRLGFPRDAAQPLPPNLAAKAADLRTQAGEETEMPSLAPVPGSCSGPHPALGQGKGDLGLQNNMFFDLHNSSHTCVRRLWDWGKNWKKLAFLVMEKDLAHC